MKNKKKKIQNAKIENMIIKKKCMVLAAVMTVLCVTSCSVRSEEEKDEMYPVNNISESISSGNSVTEKNISESGGSENSVSENSISENDLSEMSGMKAVSLQGMIDSPQPLERKNVYDTLSVATYITKINGLYFIADCYHNQIIYHDNLEDPLNQWNVLTDDVHYAHTIVSDGTMLLVDDTENNRLLAFQRTENGYMHTQTLENIGMKPHYVQYDKEKKLFLAWSSITGELYLLRRAAQPDENGIYPFFIENILKIQELYGVYVRSFTIMEDGIYFVSGHNNRKIIKAVINDAQDSLDIVAKYDVPPEIAGMVQLSQIGDYYYITVSTDDQENQDYATMIRTKDLEALENGAYEDVYAMFGVSGGTPYYITEIEKRYYLTHHRTSENILVFDVIDNVIENVEIIY